MKSMDRTRTYTKPLTDEEVENTFGAVFDNPLGHAVLDYLERTARFKMSRNQPSLEAALYQVAQLELISLMRHLSRNKNKGNHSNGEQQ